MKRHFLVWVALVWMAQMSWGVDPSVTLTTYYAGIDGKATDSNDALRVQLCTIISEGYTTIGYSSLPNSVYAASSNPSDFYNGSNKTMEDIYSSKAYVAGDAGSTASTCGTGWNKEHTVPQSYFAEESPMKSDAHHVFPTDIKMNSVRSNYPYGENANSKACDEYGYGHLGTSTFPGYTGTVFDPGEGGANGSYKGDLARVYFYMVTRYRTTNFTQDNQHNGEVSFTYSDGVADLTDYMKNLMLKWHREDPVSEKELIRNNAIYAHQKNRNPFVDYPCLVEYIWGEHKGESVELSVLISGYSGEGTSCCSEDDYPIPDDYYTPVVGLKDSLLKSRLAEITWTHYTKRYSYGSGSNNRTWAAFWYTDRNETDNSVIDMYSNNKRYFNPDNKTASVTDCDIEHMFPNSWFGGEDGNQHAYCDLNHLVPADYSANRSKGNAGPGLPTDSSFNNGVWVNGKDANRGNLYVFCPPDEYKGDFARAFFYIATTYGDTAVWQTDNSVPHMTNADWHEFLPETRDLLLKWHREDPVSEKEMIRNNTVYGLQGNRNPFIDYPCLAEYIWGTMQGEEFDLSCSTEPVAKYTITWNVQGETSSNHVTEGVKPSAPSVDDCSTDRVFVGWTTSAAVSGTKPAVLYASSEIPHASASDIYYAVFADKEVTAGGSTNTSYAPSDFEGQGTSGTGSAISVTKNGVTFACDKGFGGNSETRCYKNGVITISSSTPITALAFTFSGSYTGGLETSYTDLNTTEWTYKLTSQARFKSITVTTGGTTTYSNYGLLCETCTPEVPSASFAASTKSTTCGGSVSNALDKGGSAGTVSYTSSDTDVATVDANSGAVTINKTGTTVITAYIAAAGCYASTSASYTLTVNPKEATTAFINPTTTLEEKLSTTNAAETTSDGTIVYASNNTAVATVNASTGEVTAVKPGTARITANVAATDCYAASSAYYDLTVTAIPTYTITWKANGVTVQTDEVQREALYSLPDDPADCSENRVFKGWTVVKDYEDATSAPEDLFNSPFWAPVVTQDTTIYAVYADKKNTVLPGEMVYTKITNTSDLEDGKYLIVFAAEKVDSVAFDGSLTALDAVGDTIKVSISDNTIAGSTKVNASTFTLKATTSGGYTIQSASGYYIGQKSDANGLSTSLTEKYENSISFKVDTAVIVSGGAYLRYNKATNQARFRYYKSDTYVKQQPVYLYKQSATAGEIETTYVNYGTRCGEEYDFKALAATKVSANSFMANWTESGGDYYTLDVTTDVKKPKEINVFEKDFTESLSGWTIHYVSGYEDVWAQNTKYGAYANSFVSDVANAAESWLLSPNIDLTDVAAPSLTLNQVFRFATSVYLKVKEESATEWDELSPTNWSAASSWTFVNSVADLSAYAGKVIQVGFQYVGTTDACPAWEIKRITITGTKEVDDIASIEGYPREIYGTSASVTGLKPETTYYYTVTAEGGIISNRIEVTTLEDAPTDTENVFQAPEVRKLLINGQLYIVREGKIYTIQGLQVQ